MPVTVCEVDTVVILVIWFVVVVVVTCPNVCTPVWLVVVKVNWVAVDTPVHENVVVVSVEDTLVVVFV